MTIQSTIDPPVKPRVLIADDSRIVRATLIKHIEGMFEFREALNGEEAWETLLIDPGIRVVITDLTMPKLDGYGLMQRIRSSKIGRIRDIPVIVVSGSDECEERERAKAAGANDLITKGIGTAQLLSRLDVLARLAGSQHEFKRSQEAAASTRAESDAGLLPSGTLMEQAEALLANAVRNSKNFIVLNVCVGLKCVGVNEITAPSPTSMVDEVGQLLVRTVRQTDLVARTGRGEFTLVVGGITAESAHSFAQRICGAIFGADLTKDERKSCVACCGLASLDDDGNASAVNVNLLIDVARRRGVLGLELGITGVVGAAEESELNRVKCSRSKPDTQAQAGALPDLATLLQWAKEGRQAEVLPYIGKLSTELRLLVDLLPKAS